MAVPTTTAKAPASRACRAWAGVWMRPSAISGTPKPGGGDLFQQLQVRALCLGALAGVAGQRGADQVRPGLDGRRGVVERTAVRHDQGVGIGVDASDGLGQGQPVGALPAGAVDRHDVGAGVGHGQGVARVWG